MVFTQNFTGPHDETTDAMRRAERARLPVGWLSGLLLAGVAVVLFVELARGSPDAFSASMVVKEGDNARALLGLAPTFALAQTHTAAAPQRGEKAARRSLATASPSSFTPLQASATDVSVVTLNAAAWWPARELGSSVRYSARVSTDNVVCLDIDALFNVTLSASLPLTFPWPTDGRLTTWRFSLRCAGH